MRLASSLKAVFLAFVSLALPCLYTHDTSAGFLGQYYEGQVETKLYVWESGQAPRLVFDTISDIESAPTWGPTHRDFDGDGADQISVDLIGDDAGAIYFSQNLLGGIESGNRLSVSRVVEQEPSYVRLVVDADVSLWTAFYAGETYTQSMEMKVRGYIAPGDRIGVRYECESYISPHWAGGWVDPWVVGESVEEPGPFMIDLSNIWETWTVGYWWQPNGTPLYDGWQVPSDFASSLTFEIFKGGVGTTTIEVMDPSNIATVLPGLVEGDYTGDGAVDASDYTVWRDSLGSSTNLVADGNGSGTVDQDDYDFWKAHFGLGCSSFTGESAATNPEPSTLSIFLSAGLVVILQRGDRFKQFSDATHGAVNWVAS